MLGGTKRICLTLGAIFSLLTVVLLLSLVVYAFMTISSIKERSASEDAVAFLLGKPVEASNLSADILDFYSLKRSEKLIEWINMNPDSPWKAKINPSAIGLAGRRFWIIETYVDMCYSLRMESQDQAETISHVVEQSAVVRKSLEELRELIVKVTKQ